MKESYALAYRRLYERHWWWRVREDLLLTELDRLSPPQGFQTILDIGCGDGLFFDKLAAYGEVEGIEPNESLLSEGSKHRHQIHVGSFDSSFQPKKRYGLILLLDVLEHLPDAEKAIRHALSLLEPSGMVLVTVPAFNVLWTSHDDVNHHLERYTRRSFCRVANKCGLQVSRCRYFFFWLFPAKLVLRFTEFVFRRPPTIARVPPLFINWLLIVVCRLEESVLGRVPLPFGSSLLVVGRQKPLMAPVDDRA